MNRQWLTKNRKAVAITRVASVSQMSQGQIKEQGERIRAYCEMRGLYLQHEHSSVFVESGRGPIEKRKRYAQALKRAISARVRHLVFFSYDRMSRNLGEDVVFDLIKRDVFCVHFAREFYCLHSENYNEMVCSVIPAAKTFYERTYGRGISTHC